EVVLLDPLHPFGLLLVRKIDVDQTVDGFRHSVLPFVSSSCWSATLSTFPDASIGTSPAAGVANHTDGTLNALSAERTERRTNSTLRSVTTRAATCRRPDPSGTSVTCAWLTPSTAANAASTSAGYTVAPLTLTMSSTRPDDHR